MQEKQVIFLTGYPSSGKTFIGDYLQTRGWFHIDGDMGSQSQDPVVQKAWAGIQSCFQIKQKTGTVPAEYWTPYYEILVSQIKQAQEKHNKVAISFACLNVSGQAPWMQEKVPGIKYMTIQVSQEEILKRFFKRNDQMLAAAGLTLEQCWAMDTPQMVQVRKDYGDEYSYEKYYKMIKTMLIDALSYDDALEFGWVVDNENLDGWKEVEKILGLEPGELNTEAIAAVNMERMKKINYPGTNKAKERTFIMIKPDGVQRGLVGAIIQRFEQRGFKLAGMKVCQPGKEHLEKHYADLSGKKFFPGLIEYMNSGPVCAMIWEGDNAVKTGRKMLGATKPFDSEPGTIRGDFCIDVGRNICHGSDSVESATHEIALWFKQEEVMTYDHHSSAWIYE